MNPKLSIKTSLIEGRGVFAVDGVRKDEVLCVFGGKVVTGEEVDRLIAEDGDRSHYNLKIDENTHLITPTRAGHVEEDLEPGDFFNHSCEPNAGFRGQVTFVAMRDILSGTEVTYDYAMNDDDDDWEVSCCCASASCRKKITGKDWKDAVFQKKYDGYLAAHILRMVHTT